MTAVPLDMTVVIRCAGEQSIIRCLESIDADVEVIVTLPEGTAMDDVVARLGARVIRVPRLQMGLTTNLGTAAARRSKLLIMDSDCWFSEGCLQAVDKALDALPVVRTKVLYEKAAHNPLSAVVAEARDFDNYADERYWFPGLGIRKDTIEALGGEICHPKLWWVEDADLHNQLVERGLVSGYHCAGEIHHGPLTLSHEIRSQLRYGRGGALRAYLRAETPRYFGAHESAWRRFREIRRKKGLIVACYKTVMNIMKTAAMWQEHRRLAGKRHLGAGI